MKSSCPSMMVVCTVGSKGNGRIQSREFPLKIHDLGEDAASRSSTSIRIGQMDKGCTIDYYDFLLWHLFWLVNGDVVTTWT